MLVCSCNFISENEIRTAIIAMLEEDCWQLIVPAKLYHAMKKRGRCCGCFPDVVDLIITTTTEFHQARSADDAASRAYLERMRQFHDDNRRNSQSRSAVRTPSAA